MGDTISDERARILAALTSLVRACSGRSPEHVKAANEAIRDLRKPRPGIRVVNGFGHASFSLELAPMPVLTSLAKFVNEDLAFLTELPAPWIVPRVRNLLDELGGELPAENVKDNTAQILKALADSHPILLTAEKIENAIPNLQVSLRTLQRDLPKLEKAGLVSRPAGKRSGWGIMSAGNRTLSARR